MDTIWSKKIVPVFGNHTKGELGVFLYGVSCSVIMVFVRGTPWSGTSAELLLAWFFFLTGWLSLRAFINLGFSDKAQDAKELVATAATLERPDLLAKARSSWVKMWRSISFLTIAPWTVIYVSSVTISKQLDGQMAVWIFLLTAMLALAGILASLMYFALNYVRSRRTLNKSE
jgi:hypothetical protein